MDGTKISRPTVSEMPIKLSEIKSLFRKSNRFYRNDYVLSRGDIIGEDFPYKQKREYLAENIYNIILGKNYLKPGAMAFNTENSKKVSQYATGIINVANYIKETTAPAISNLNDFSDDFMLVLEQDEPLFSEPTIEAANTDEVFISEEEVPNLYQRLLLYKDFVSIEALLDSILKNKQLEYDIKQKDSALSKQFLSENKTKFKNADNKDNSINALSYKLINGKSINTAYKQLIDIDSLKDSDFTDLKNIIVSSILNITNSPDPVKAADRLNDGINYNGIIKKKAELFSAKIKAAEKKNNTILYDENSVSEKKAVSMIDYDLNIASIIKDLNNKKENYNLVF